MSMLQTLNLNSYLFTFFHQYDKIEQINHNKCRKTSGTGMFTMLRFTFTNKEFLEFEREIL